MLITPLEPVSGKWNKFEESRPYPCVNGFAYDKQGRFPIMFRSNLVRSARNAWSLPSGLHEPGLTLEQQFCQELHEELNLEAELSTCRKVCVYENIATADNWHWVITVLTVRVKTLDTLVNKEPDKHPTIETPTVKELFGIINSRPWTPGLQEIMRTYYEAICSNIVTGMSE
jgi:ADP-ribose pyrophosphatase YjhB (NUDIX family)